MDQHPLNECEIRPTFATSRAALLGRDDRAHARLAGGRNPSQLCVQLSSTRLMPADSPSSTGSSWGTIIGPGTSLHVVTSRIRMGAIGSCSSTRKQKARLAFEQVEQMAAPTWPEDGIPPQLHLDLSVPTVEELAGQYERALSFGAGLLYDASMTRSNRSWLSRIQQATPSASSSHLRRRRSTWNSAGSASPGVAASADAPVAACSSSNRCARRRPSRWWHSGRTVC